MADSSGSMNDGIGTTDEGVSDHIVYKEDLASSQLLSMWQGGGRGEGQADK